jgi:hypothetical protein
LEPFYVPDHVPKLEDDDDPNIFLAEPPIPIPTRPNTPIPPARLQLPEDLPIILQAYRDSPHFRAISRISAQIDRTLRIRVVGPRRFRLTRVLTLAAALVLLLDPERNFHLIIHHRNLRRQRN